MGTGMADVLSICRGHECWVELKCAPVPARPLTPLLGKQCGLSVDQMNWHLNWFKNGGTSAVLIRDDAGELYLISNRHTDIVNSLTRNALREARITDNWGGILNWLRNYEN